MRPLLVLRPEPGATATVERARDIGLDARAVPLFELEPIEWSVPEDHQYDALLLTSANAARFGGERLRPLLALPVHAVGSATADAAREVGLRVASVGQGGVDELLKSLPSDLKLLHLAGEHRKLPSSPRRITAISAYRAREVRNPNLRDLRGCVALLHSPRAGRRFAELIEDRANVAVAAISPAAVDELGSGWEIVEAADEPSDDALLALAARLCNKPVTK
jgi:uroporphyrinogen-III synthase